MKRKSDNLGAIGIVTIGLAIATVPTVVNAADAEGLEACQSIEDDAARLACFDASLSPEPEPATKATPPKPAPPQESKPESAAPVAAKSEPAAKPPAAAPAPIPTAQTGTLSDDIGRESVNNVDRDALAARGRLARCDMGRSGKYVFYFDNGQVWRQKSSARVPWKECDFEVTISKDLFGYTMVRDGEKRKVRIERVK